jgi:site-specific DNA-methyltransferase (adenine-specific)
MYFFDENTDAFKIDWLNPSKNKTFTPKTFWMNPPYGRYIKEWIKLAYEWSFKGATVVCLIPGRTDTNWFHNYVPKAAEIRFIRHRINFVGGPSGSPFPSVVVIFKPDTTQDRIIRFWDWEENKYY